MALDPKATPEEQFKAWLAEQEANLVPLPRHLPGRPAFWTGAVLSLVSLFIWVVTLWRLVSGLSQLLRALQG